MLLAASLLAAIAVIAGALSAHMLEKKLGPEQISQLHTAANYQMFHALGLAALAALAGRLKKSQAASGGLLLGGGAVLFSFSIYFLATRSLWGAESIKWVAYITPVGGMLMILGWLYLAFIAIRGMDQKRERR